MKVTAPESNSSSERLYTAPERAAACHWRNYCKVEVCDHSAADAISYTQVGGEKHRKYCKYCGLTEEVVHAYTDNKCECGKVFNEATDTWTVTIYKATDINSTAYDAGTVYHVIKGKSFPVPAPDAIEGLTFMQWKQNPASSPENIEMKDADFDPNATVALEITPTGNTTLYAQYRYAYNEVWTWAADHSSATLTLKQGDVVVKSDIAATVTTEEQEATASENGYKKYTATAQWEKASGITYQFTDWYETPYVTELTIQDNADNDDLLWENYGAQVQKVELSGRTLYKDGSWNTLCLPFDVTLNGSPLEGAIAKTLVGAEMSDNNLSLTFSEAVTTLEAGVPYIIMWNKAEGYDTADPATRDIKNPVFTDVTVVSSPDADRTISLLDGAVKFVGYYDPFGITADDTDIYYMTANNTLKHTGVARTLLACRAYFQFSDESAAARQITLNFGDDETTRIIELKNSRIEELKSEDGWYTVDGVKLDKQPTRKGLYIHNGRKVVIK